MSAIIKPQGVRSNELVGHFWYAQAVNTEQIMRGIIKLERICDDCRLTKPKTKLKFPCTFCKVLYYIESLEKLANKQITKEELQEAFKKDFSEASRISI